MPCAGKQHDCFIGSIFRISLSGSWDSSIWVFAYITAGHSYKILSVNIQNTRHSTTSFNFFPSSLISTAVYIALYTYSYAVYRSTAHCIVTTGLCTALHSIACWIVILCDPYTHGIACWIVILCDSYTHGIACWIVLCDPYTHSIACWIILCDPYTHSIAHMVTSRLDRYSRHCMTYNLVGLLTYRAYPALYAAL